MSNNLKYRVGDLVEATDKYGTVRGTICMIDMYDREMPYKVDRDDDEYQRYPEDQIRLVGTVSQTPEDLKAKLDTPVLEALEAYADALISGNGALLPELSRLEQAIHTRHQHRLVLEAADKVKALYS